MISSMIILVFAPSFVRYITASKESSYKYIHDNSKQSKALNQLDHSRTNLRKTWCEFGGNMILKSKTNAGEIVCVFVFLHMMILIKLVKIVNCYWSFLKWLCRGHDEEQIGVSKREARHPRAAARGARSPSEQRDDQPLCFHIRSVCKCLTRSQRSIWTCYGNARFSFPVSFILITDDN